MVIKSIKKNNLYYLQGDKIIKTVAIVSKEKMDFGIIRLQNMCLGDPDEKTLQNLVKRGLLKGVKIGKLEFCEHCVQGKQSKVKFGLAIHVTQGNLDNIHLDVWGPTRTSSLGAMHYFFTFVDDFSRRVQIYVIKTNNVVLDRFLKWKTMVENPICKKIKRLQTNNSTEYANDPLEKVYKVNGII